MKCAVPAQAPRAELALCVLHRSSGGVQIHVLKWVTLRTPLSQLLWLPGLYDDPLALRMFTSALRNENLKTERVKW